MPTNLYGINDNFDLKTSHVFLHLIRKFHKAKISNRKMLKYVQVNQKENFYMLMI